MNLVGTNAMALGPYELALGTDVLRERMGESEFPIVSANVFVTSTADLFASAYVILDVAGYRVGVVGLSRQPKDAVADFYVQDPTSAAAAVVPELRSQSDTVILLTNLEYRQAMALASAVPGIDLVIAANPGQLPTQAVVVPATNSLIVAAEQPVAQHTGRRVGRLQVTIRPDGTLSNPTWQSVSLDETFADDAAMATLLDQFRQ
jgi:2',3'-cyclic-nucleotide 2'-phosphodiesterase (5'-nucleotidase family)